MSTLCCRPVALFLLVVYLAGCYTWSPTTISPPELIEEERPEQVRVTRWSGEQVTIVKPQVRADSIIGDEVGVAIEDIREIEVRRHSVAGYSMLVLMLGAITLIVADFSRADFLGSG